MTNLEPKPAERKMNNKQELEALFAFAVEGILVTNNAGEIIRINPAAEYMFGYEEGELLGKKIESLIPETLRHKHEGHRADFAHSRYSRAMGIGMDLFGKRKNNSEFPLEISLSPFTSVEGNHFVIAFIIDITVRKAQEEILRGTLTDLQHFSEELKVSNTELQNFAYVASHDLQEPLRKIQSFGMRLKQLEAEKLSTQGTDYLDRMLNAASRMQVLITDLLSFSRLTSGGKSFVAVNLNTLLEEVLSDLEVSIESAQAKIIASSLPVIDAEPTQMRQVFQNLISNAVKFRKTGEQLTLHIHATENDQTVALSFQDNGIGFDEKYTDRIFNLFERIEGKRFDGSGIGLAICRKIALWHGGTITAKSESGKGATFILTIPSRHQNTAKDVIHSI